MNRILVTGACGQIGTELIIALRAKYGRENVIATDLHDPATQTAMQVPYERLDVLHKPQLDALIKKYAVTQIYHLVAMLSARGEKSPATAWHLNMQSLLNILEAATDNKIEKVFWPSSIAVFGPDAPKKNCPQETLLNPSTIYGISKVAGEQLCTWYRKNHGLDIRSLRYPGLIGHTAPPGGGTTDYAVAIFHHAVKYRKYKCFLNAGTRLPMLYLDDAVKGTLQLMDAPQESLKHTAYNLGGMHFTPVELAREIQAFLPDFTITYHSDERQQIADSWPHSLDDSAAKSDWGWQPSFDIDTMAADMLQHIKAGQEAVPALL